MIVGHEKLLICYQELRYEKPAGTEKTFVLIIPALNRDVYVVRTYLYVDALIFAYSFMVNYILLTSVSCQSHFHVWKLRKSLLLVFIWVLDLWLTVLPHLALEAVSASPKLSLPS